MAPSAEWFVYLAACGDGSLYAGVTTDPARRLAEHRAGRGARYTRARGILGLVWAQPVAGRSAALQLEAALKRLPRRTKLELAAFASP